MNELSFTGFLIAPMLGEIINISGPSTSSDIPTSLVSGSTVHTDSRGEYMLFPISYYLTKFVLFTVNSFRHENLLLIKHYFTDFVSIVKNGLKRNEVSVNSIMVLKYRKPALKSIDEIVTFLLERGYWNYYHYDHLYHIIDLFGDDAMKKAMKEYEQHVKSYVVGAKLIDFVAKNNMLSGASVRGTSSTSGRRQSEEYCGRLSVILHMEITKSSLNNVESLWKQVFGLPNVGVILDSIVDNGPRVTVEERSHSAVSVQTSQYLDSLILLT